jgi:transketolase
MASEQQIARLEELAYEMRKKLLEFCGSYEGTVHSARFVGNRYTCRAYIYEWHEARPELLFVCPIGIVSHYEQGDARRSFAMYLAMALRGFFNYDDTCMHVGKVKNKRIRHASCKVHLPGVECLPARWARTCYGGWLGNKRKRTKVELRIFCMMGDGETCEGEVWEAALCASSYKLGNLIGIVDRNRLLMTSASAGLYQDGTICGQWRHLLECGRDQWTRHEAITNAF